MAGGSPQTGSSKELTAIIVNLKEARILDKSVQTLSLEESYASKLLDLNSKMVKFNYRRLKNNVNKIRTNLKAEDISAMRSLELEGRFKAEHPRICSSSSATKIAAAHRRLNLNAYRRVQSAMPRIQQRKQESLTDEADEVDADTSANPKKTCQEPTFSCSQRKPRPKTTVLSGHSEPELKEQTPRPKSTLLVLEKITRAQKANKIHAPQVSYSCHDEKPEGEDAKGNKSVLDAFGPNPYEERRQKLLQMESRTFLDLRKKKQGFVDEVEEFIAKNPCSVSTEPAMTQEIINSIDSMTARPADERQEDRLSKHIDISLVNKAIFTEDIYEREYYTVSLMRKGKRHQRTTEDLFIPARYKMVT